jgi:ribokinase
MRHAAVAGSLACAKPGAQPSFPLREAIELSLGGDPAFP